MKIQQSAVLALATIAAFAILYSPSVGRSEEIVAQVIPSVVEPKIEPWKKLRKELIPVCSCESTGNKNGIPTQYDSKGNLLLGRENPSDRGMCQINLDAHGIELEKLGIDVDTEEGNVEFANILYDREGLTPWSWSKSCWE